MAESRRRRLAAIMFADMEGFTALMQEDENAAHARRDRYREVLGAAVTRHGGRIRQYYGDGALSTFESAVEAVRCAVEVQLELAREPRVPVRIGVHAGDIVLEAEGVYGDGVNVASRVEGLCAPGGVMISGKVFDEIKNHPPIAAVPFGPFRLRNVARPVEIFAVSSQGLPVPSPGEVRARAAPGGGSAVAAPGPGEGADPPQGPGEAFLRAVKERSMVPWAIAYLAAAGILLGLLRFTADLLVWPPVVLRGAELLAFVGLLVTLVVTWHHGQRGRQRVRRGEVALVVALLLAGLGGLALLDAGRDGVRSGAPGDRIVTPPAGDDRPSVAVLPFESLSPDPGDAYFAHGVQEDITTALSRVHSVRVPGRSSVERYRDARPTNRRVALTLGVDYLLEGTARIAGNAVKVTVALVDGRTDERLWSEEYEREFTVEQMIAVQADVAREVAGRLRVLVTPEDSARMTVLPTSQPEAWVLFQRGRYRWNRRTEADVHQARILFEAAIQLDSTFAAPWAGLADVYLVLANWGWMDHRAAYANGIAAAEKALELDSLMASAHASLGGLRFWSSRDWAGSERSFRRAIELDPEYSYAHYWFAALLGALGRHDEATAEARLAWSLDPLAPQVAYGLVRSYFLARDYDRAVEEARRALEVHPDYGNLHSILCSTRIAAGALDAAEDACAPPSRRSEHSYDLNRAILRAHQGRREEALAEVERARSDAGVEGMQPVILAMVHAGLGQPREALDLLERAVAEGYPHVDYLSNHPFFDPLQSEPRYRELLRRLGLPARS